MFIENRIRKENEQIVVIWKTFKKVFPKEGTTIRRRGEIPGGGNSDEECSKERSFHYNPNNYLRNSSKSELVRTSEAVQAKKSIR